MSQRGGSAGRRAARGRRTLAPGCEGLERRELMAAFAPRFGPAPVDLPAAEVRAAAHADRPGVAAAASVARPAAAMPARARAAALESALQRVMAEYRVPGAVVGVVTPGQRPWKVARGLADVADGRPLALNERFQVRSVAKSFTTTLVLRLAREGRVSLSDPIGRYVQDIPNGDRITLAELAGMRSGIQNYTLTPAFGAAFVADPARRWSPSELVALGIPDSPVFEPGAQYDYSNTNTVLLGMVAARVTGRPLDRLFPSAIFGPLGLRQTSYQKGIAAGEPAPTPYEVDPDTGALETVPQANLTSLGASGAIVTTMPDLLRWGRALGTGRLIGPRLLQLREAAAIPATNGPEYDRYGLGIGQLKGWWGHTGQGFGFQAATFYDPATRSVIAVALNSSQPENVATQIFKALADVVRPG